MSTELHPSFGEESRPAQSPSVPQTVRITYERVCFLGIEVLRAAGAQLTQAQAQINQLVEADLCGRPSHGMQRLPTLVERIHNGVLIPAAEPTTTYPSTAVVLVDGQHGFGPPAALAAADALAVLSHNGGIALAAIRNSGHLGMLAPYVERLANAGLIAIALSTSEALVHPAGGREPLLGTNPIAIAVPVHPLPFVLDMATAAISAGEVISHVERGAQLPAGRAVDSSGWPTTDPEAALRGAISPFGGAKGYGLALAFELMVALLTRTELGVDVRGTLDSDRQVTKGDLLIAIDPRAIFGEESDNRLAAYIDTLRCSPAAPGVERVLIPGDRMRAERQRRMVDGIPYPERTWRRLIALDGAAAAH